MSMNQTEARAYAKQVGGIACTRDTHAGRFDTTFEWGVALPGTGAFVTDQAIPAGVFNVSPLLTPAQHAEWFKLDQARIATADAYERNDSDQNYDRREAAFDAEADWIEAEGLNYTTYDPRGLTDD